MSREPKQFKNHPVSFEGARKKGLLRGVVEDITDGDTVDVFVDLPFRAYNYLPIRIEGYDAPEIYRPETDEEKRRGYEAKKYLQYLLLDKPILMKPVKDKMSFDRYRAWIWFYSTSDEKWVPLWKHMKSKGYHKIEREK